MDFKKRFQKELQEYQSQQRSEKEEKQTREQEERRTLEERRQLYRQKVERAHKLLKPTLDDFIRTTRFRLKRVPPLSKTGERFTVYEYKVTRKEGWLIWALEYSVTEVLFGHNRGIVRVGVYGDPYPEEDLLDEDRLKEKFTRDLINVGKLHLSH